MVQENERIDRRSGDHVGLLSQKMDFLTQRLDSAMNAIVTDLRQHEERDDATLENVNQSLLGIKDVITAASKEMAHSVGRVDERVRALEIELSAIRSRLTIAISFGSIALAGIMSYLFTTKG